MITTMHEIGPDHTVEQRRRRPRITSPNSIWIREVFGAQPVKKLPIPKFVDDYNYNIGGVDIADQLRAV